jgi:hypothetical protein
MGKLLKWVAGWKIIKAVFRTGETRGRTERY